VAARWGFCFRACKQTHWSHLVGPVRRMHSATSVMRRNVRVFDAASLDSLRFSWMVPDLIMRRASPCGEAHATAAHRARSEFPPWLARSLLC